MSRYKPAPGKTAASWYKHSLLWEIGQSQMCAYQRKKGGHLLVIDMHAGDGHGVEKPIFLPGQSGTLWPRVSDTTADLAIRLARVLPQTEAILCETAYGKRLALAQKFPGVRLLLNHTQLPAVLKHEYPHVDWALVLNDPNGPADHGIETMQSIAHHLAADFVIVFNEGAIHRLRGLRSPGPTQATRAAYAARETYTWMLDPCAWAQRLGRRRVAWTPLQHPSANFHYRLIVVANAFARAITPKRFEVIR